MEASALEVGQRVTFHPNDTKTNLTGQIVDKDDSTVTLKCGRAVIPTMRDKGVYTEAREPDHTHSKEHAKEKAQTHVGEQGKVFLAKAQGTYKGSIVEMTPTFAIQKVNSETAILHRLKDLETSKDNGHELSEGREVVITKSNNGVTIEPWNKEREEKERVREREHNRGSQSR